MTVGRDPDPDVARAQAWKDNDDPDHETPDDHPAGPAGGSRLYAMGMRVNALAGIAMATLMTMSDGGPETPLTITSRGGYIG